MQDTILALRETLAILPRFVESASREVLGRRPAPTEWSAHLVLVHLALNELNTAVSVRRMLTEERPLLGEIDDGRVDRFGEGEPTATLRLWRTLREDLVVLASSLSRDDLDRTGVAPWRVERNLSVADYLSSRARHDSEHLAQMRAALDR